MRLEIKLITNKTLEVNRDYRKHFISFLKLIFSKSYLKEHFYNNKKFKPFVFSVWLGDKFEINTEKIKAGNEIYFLFSTGDPSIFINFYNGIVDFKKSDEEIHLGNGNLKIKDITLKPLKKIKENKILCRTIGISVLTNPNASAKDFKNWYVVPTDDLTLFNNVLKKRINEKFEFINCINKDFEIELIPLTENEFHILKYFYKLDFETSIIETIVKHYNGYIRGFRGFFWLEGDKEILQFIYDYGLGVRTGQGFGMIDILGQDEN